MSTILQSRGTGQGLSGKFFSRGVLDKDKAEGRGQSGRLILGLYGALHDGAASVDALEILALFSRLTSTAGNGVRNG